MHTSIFNNTLHSSPLAGFLSHPIYFSLSLSLVLLPLLGTVIDVFEFYFKKYASHLETCVVSWALVEIGCIAICHAFLPSFRCLMRLEALLLLKYRDRLKNGP